MLTRVSALVGRQRDEKLFIGAVFRAPLVRDDLRGKGGDGWRRRVGRERGRGDEESNISFIGSVPRARGGEGGGGGGRGGGGGEGGLINFQAGRIARDEQLLGQVL